MALIGTTITAYFSQHSQYAVGIFELFCTDVCPIQFEGKDEYKNDVICFIANEKHNIVGNLNLPHKSSRSKKGSALVTDNDPKEEDDGDNAVVKPQQVLFY